MVSGVANFLFQKFPKKGWSLYSFILPSISVLSLYFPVRIPYIKGDQVVVPIPLTSPIFFLFSALSVSLINSFVLLIICLWTFRHRAIGTVCSIVLRRVLWFLFYLNLVALELSTTPWILFSRNSFTLPPLLPTMLNAVLSWLSLPCVVFKLSV